MTLFALVGPVSKELLSFNGQVLVHDNKAELEWLIPGVKVIQLPKADIGRPTMPIKDHPDMAAVRWPLDKRHFQ